MNPHDEKHKKRINRYLDKINGHFDALVTEISIIVVNQKVSEKIFKFRDYKTITNRVSESLKKYQNNLISSIKVYSQYEWDFANAKVDDILKTHLEGIKGKVPSSLYVDKIRQISIESQNQKAFEAFQERKHGKFTISERVWNITDQAKENLEFAIDVALKEGMSAQELARSIKSNLNNPDALFRRVRDKHGNLVLSQNAKSFHPGQGVYRSAHKNALRLAADVINTSYRECEQLRISANNDVVGQKINLSPSHKVYDMCFTNWNYKITTSKGPKNIKDIEVGDLVLTHKGRFRPVTQLFKSHAYEVPQTEIYYEIPYDNRKKTHKITATDNHPFLINGEWKPISEAKEGEMITILSTQCKSCGKDIPVQRDYCSKSCSSLNTATNQWKDEEHRKSVTEKRNKLIADNGGKIPYFQDWINSGENIKNLLRPDVMAKSNMTNRIRLKELSKNGLHPFQNPENHKKAMKAKGNIHKASFIERKVQWLLGELDIDFELNYIFYRKEKRKNGFNRFYVPDIFLPKYNIVIECDGTYWHSSPEVKMKDAQKDKEYKEAGLMVLRFTDHQINKDLRSVAKEIQRVVYNHEGKYEFMQYPISKVVHKVRKQSTPITKWNFAVEEDNSYICQNIVVHNCDELAGTYPKDFNWSKWHVSCKCFRTPILKSTDELISEINEGLNLPPESSKNHVSKLPDNFNQWLSDNEKKMENWKRKPEFITKNEKLLK